MVIREDTIPKRIRKLNRVSEDPRLIVDEVAQKWDNRWQHTSLNRTTLKPHAVEDVQRSVGVGVL